jgi:histidine phosphotransferase ChpT
MKFDELYTAQKYGAPPDEPVDAHSVQAYYTLLLASEAGMTIDVASDDEKIVFSAA